MTNNERLRKEGYGWKRLRVMCLNSIACGWKGRRIWRRKMFDKPCPWCKMKFKSGRTTVFCQPQMKG